jgi:hypothetical protein
MSNVINMGGLQADIILDTGSLDSDLGKDQRLPAVTGACSTNRSRIGPARA